MVGYTEKKKTYVARFLNHSPQKSHNLKTSFAENICRKKIAPV